MVGSITDAVGLTDNAGKRAATKAANVAADRAYAQSEEQIQFAREQYADWKSIYGDIQTNLGEFYKQYGEDKIMSLGLNAQQKEYQVAKAEVQKNLAQRGLKNSGIEADILATGEFNNANARANIRATAKDQAAERKLAFLGIGLGQGANFLGGVNSAYSTGVSSATNLSSVNRNAATQLSIANMQSMSDLIGTAAGAATGGAK